MQVESVREEVKEPVEANNNEMEGKIVDNDDLKANHQDWTTTTTTRNEMTESLSHQMMVTMTMRTISRTTKNSTALQLPLLFNQSISSSRPTWGTH